MNLAKKSANLLEKKMFRFAQHDAKNQQNGELK